MPPKSLKKTPNATPPVKNSKPVDNVTTKFAPVRCKKCNKECLDAGDFTEEDDDSISCDVCNFWFHKSCTDTSSSEWQALKGSNENITYCCNGCLKSKGQSHNQLESIKQLLEANNEQLISRIENIETRIMKSVDDKIEIKMKEYEEKYNKAIDEKIDAKFAAADKNKEEKVVIENAIKSHVSEHLDELKEKEEKKLNLMLFNLRESTKTDIIEEASEDLSSVKEVLQHINSDLKESVIDKLSTQNIKRLGRKPDTSQDGKTRPVKVTLPDEYTKYKFLRRSHKLKDYRPNPKIGIKLDLTKQQMFEEKELRKELQRRREQNEDVMIFRNKVIFRADHEKLKREPRPKEPTAQNNNSQQC